LAVFSDPWRQKSTNLEETAMSLLNSDRNLRIAIATAATALFAGCSSMQMGSPDAKTTATGSAAGSTTDNASSQLEKCSSSLGTVTVVEDTHAPWYGS
jgi:hypothetical protein